MKRKTLYDKSHLKPRMPSFSCSPVNDERRQIRNMNRAVHYAFAVDHTHLG
jgi:hypothetical protein